MMLVLTQIGCYKRKFKTYIWYPKFQKRNFEFHTCQSKYETWMIAELAGYGREDLLLHRAVLSSELFLY
jgi:hypothetical protein